MSATKRRVADEIEAEREEAAAEVRFNTLAEVDDIAAEVRRRIMCGLDVTLDDVLAMLDELTEGVTS
jgi:hypothetical protein